MGYMGVNATGYDVGDCVPFCLAHRAILVLVVCGLKPFLVQVVSGGFLRRVSVVVGVPVQTFPYVTVYHDSLVNELLKVVLVKVCHEVLVVLYHEGGGLLKPKLIVSQSPLIQTQVSGTRQGCLHLEIMAVIYLVDFQGECSLHD